MLHLALLLLAVSLMCVNGILLPESARHVNVDINQHVEDGSVHGHAASNDVLENWVENPKLKVQENWVENPKLKVEENWVENPKLKVEENWVENPKLKVQENWVENPKLKVEENWVENPKLKVEENWVENPKLKVEENWVEDKKIKVKDTVHQVSNNTIGETQITQTRNQSRAKGNSIKNVCNIHEDCEKGKYCRHQKDRSSCRNCKPLDERCSEDKHCCTGLLCVWGQCSQNTTKGQAGSTCKKQSECSHDLCCAVHQALLFPVCKAKPIERERCVEISNDLTALLPGDKEDESPRQHCPCVRDLKCKNLGHGSTCL
ncbi:hypothetical protein DPEC_G00347220 [Dallia pectoralis]|uniref:Uncharacterized protein n=1 Tax=Dallia pectoralis TaxID=75939 RepID=A0ACC2F416_DALPE|nr:hypothetical protein DPEC_G00347220 [Dallia pectoralis]